MYYLSILIAASAGVLYHVSQKSIPDKANPMVSMMITFSVALIATMVWYFIEGSSSPLISDAKNTNWASISLGLAIVGLEFGILLAYRSGWQISNFNLFYTTSLVLILIPIGITFYNEILNIKTIIGICVSIVGLIIIKI